MAVTNSDKQTVWDLPSVKMFKSWLDRQTEKDFDRMVIEMDAWPIHKKKKKVRGMYDIDNDGITPQFIPGQTVVMFLYDRNDVDGEGGTKRERLEQALRLGIIKYVDNLEKVRQFVMEEDATSLWTESGGRAAGAYRACECIAADVPEVPVDRLINTGYRCRAQDVEFAMLQRKDEIMDYILDIRGYSHDNLHQLIMSNPEVYLNILDKVEFDVNELLRKLSERKFESQIAQKRIAHIAHWLTMNGRLDEAEKVLSYVEHKSEELSLLRSAIGSRLGKVYPHHMRIYQRSKFESRSLPEHLRNPSRMTTLITEGAQISHYLSYEDITSLASFNMDKLDAKFPNSIYFLDEDQYDGLMAMIDFASSLDRELFPTLTQDIDLFEELVALGRIQKIIQ